MIAATDAGDFKDCADIKISDNVADELIAADSVDSMDCADTYVLYDAVDGLMMLICVNCSYY